MPQIGDIKKRGIPQRYVLWSDWERWLLTQWLPFKTNDFVHLKNRVRILFIEVSFILAFVALILALLSILAIRLI